MKKKKFILLTLSLLIFFALQGKANSVAAVSNTSFFEGNVIEFAIVSSRLAGIKPEQRLYKLTVKIESSHAIGEGPDFLHKMVGQEVCFYSRHELSSDLFGKKIKARARYKGDERGGMYWIYNIALIERGKSH